MCSLKAAICKACIAMHWRAKATPWSFSQRASPSARRIRTGSANSMNSSDVAISNCNVFWLRNAKALRATEAFREGGQFAKNRARIAKAFGIINLIRFRLGWWTLDKAFKAISRRFGVQVVPQITPVGAFAIDVDNERTYGVAELLLKARKG
jgi:hypothetical protein